MVHIVALTGAAGAGKSTAASYLTSQFGFKLEKFAGPLKDMLRAIGLSEQEIEGEWKNDPCDLLMGRTPRHAMQTLGTEWGRGYMGENFWVNLWMARVADKRLVVVDDCRFPNEAAAVRQLGGTIIRIVRPSNLFGEEVYAHASEAHVSELPYDFEVVNDGSMASLNHRVYDLAFAPTSR